MTVTTGQHKRAQRQALALLDEWLQTTGVIDFNSSYYGEICSIVSDAVDIGIRTGVGMEVNLESYNGDGEPVYPQL